MEFKRIQQARWHRVLGSPQRLRRLTAAAALCVAAATGAWALEDTSAAKQGLRGILPKETPADLSADAFSGVNGNWEKWGKDLAGLVNKLYSDDKLDAAGQRALLNQLKDKIKVMDKALADPKFASVNDALASIRGRIARRVDVALAMLDTLELNPEQVKADAIKREKKHLLKHLDDLATYLQSIPGGSAWLKFVKADELRAAANFERDRQQDLRDD